MKFLKGIFSREPTDERRQNLLSLEQDDRLNIQNDAPPGDSIEHALLQQKSIIEEKKPTSCTQRFFDTLVQITASPLSIMLAASAYFFALSENPDDQAAGTLVVLGMNTALSLPHAFSKITQHVGATIRETSEGADDEKKRISSLPKNALLTALPAVALFVPMFYSKEIFIGIGQSDAAAEIAIKFLQPAAALVPVVTAHSILSGLYHLVGKTNHLSLINLGSVILGIGLTYLLEFHPDSFPDLDSELPMNIFWGWFAQQMTAIIGLVIGLQKMEAFKNYHFSERIRICNSESQEQLSHLVKESSIIGGLELMKTLPLAVACLTAASQDDNSISALAGLNFSLQLWFAAQALHTSAEGITVQDVSAATIDEQKPVAAKRILTGLLTPALCAPFMAYPEWITTTFTGHPASEAPDHVKTAIRLMGGSAVLHSITSNFVAVIGAMEQRFNVAFLFNSSVLVVVGVSSYLLLRFEKDLKKDVTAITALLAGNLLGALLPVLREIRKTVAKDQREEKNLSSCFSCCFSRRYLSIHQGEEGESELEKLEPLRLETPEDSLTNAAQP